jgi:hypothetical protein
VAFRYDAANPRMAATGHICVHMSRGNAHPRVVDRASRIPWIALVAVITALVAGSAAAAEPSCSPDVERWVAGCSEDASVTVKAEACSPGSLIVRARHVDGHTLRMEIKATDPATFRTAGKLGISPLGEFTDWASEPPALQRSLDVVAACVLARPPDLDELTASAPGVASEPLPPASRWPWLLLVALAVMVTSFIHGRRARPRLPPQEALALACLFGGTLLGRALAVPRAFFHQNGQGPLWVDFAWRGVRSAYGPGYAETFGRVAHAFPRSPDLAVIVANAILSALVPPLAYVIARRARAPRPLASVLAIALAIDPLLARVAQSESYFATTGALLFVAGGALACGCERLRVRSVSFALGVVTAGLLVAQVARIHPLAWVPATTLPLVVLFAGGSLRARAYAFGASVVGIGAMVAACAGSSMVLTLQSELGREWMPEASHPVGLVSYLASTHAFGLGCGAVVVILAAGVLFRHGRRRARTRVVLAVLALGTVLTVMLASNLVSRDTGAVQAAYAHGFAPALVAITAAFFGAVPARRSATIAAAVLASTLVLAFAACTRRLATLPTDAQELSWALAWERSLPPHAVVEWVARAGLRTLYLPLHRDSATPAPRMLDGTADDRLEGDVFYYRSSLCSTTEGAPSCDAFERTHTLTPVYRRTFPAIASLPWLPLPEPAIEVVLYRVAPTP